MKWSYFESIGLRIRNLTVNIMHLSILAQAKLSKANRQSKNASLANNI